MRGFCNLLNMVEKEGQKPKVSALHLHNYNLADSRCSTKLTIECAHFNHSGFWNSTESINARMENVQRPQSVLLKVVRFHVQISDFENFGGS